MLSEVLRGLNFPERFCTNETSNYSSTQLSVVYFLAALEKMPRFEPVLFIPCTALTERQQFRFPRSKKKRIRTKWAKDPRNWRDEPMRGAMRIGNSFFAHPRWLPAIKRKVERALERSGQPAYYIPAMRKGEAYGPNQQDDD